MSAVARRALAGRGILVTRPAHQSAGLAQRVRDAGGEPILFPALAIADLDDPAALEAAIGRLDEFDWAVFVSPNAAARALAAIRARRTWPARLRAAAVGRGTQRELTRHGLEFIVAPSERFDSEALLEQPELRPAQMAGRRVAIFRGDGGRELLGDVLGARGAQVEYVACYRRVKPAVDARELAQLLERWRQGGIQAVTVASTDTLHNLVDMLGDAGRALLRGTPLFVPHERIAQAASAGGIATPVVTAPGEEGLVAGLAAWFAARS